MGYLVEIHPTELWQVQSCTFHHATLCAYSVKTLSVFQMKLEVRTNQSKFSAAFSCFHLSLIFSCLSDFTTGTPSTWQWRHCQVPTSDFWGKRTRWHLALTKTGRMNSTEAANEGLLSSLNLISQGDDACNRKQLKVPTHHRMYPARLSCREFLILDHHKPSFYMLMMTYMSWTIDSHIWGALKPLRCEPVR